MFKERLEMSLDAKIQLTWWCSMLDLVSSEVFSNLMDSVIL